jgi:hypothetical protein
MGNHRDHWHCHCQWYYVLRYESSFPGEGGKQDTRHTKRRVTRCTPFNERDSEQPEHIQVVMTRELEKFNLKLRFVLQPLVS